MLMLSSCSTLHMRATVVGSLALVNRLNTVSGSPCLARGWVAEAMGDWVFGERLNTPGIIAKYTARLSIRLNAYIVMTVTQLDHVNSNITG